jgi:Na+-driven multidrug efflux pump
MGAPGVWIGMSTGLVCVTVLLVRRFNRLTDALIAGDRKL